MVRDYQSVLAAKGFWVPRWIVMTVAVLFFGTLALRILKPPQWNLQRLDSPDETMVAELWQTKYLDYSYKVKVKHGAITRTIYQGPEFKPDFTINYRPTLFWDAASEFMLFTVQGEPVMIYDAGKQSLIGTKQANQVLKERFHEQLR